MLGSPRRLLVAGAVVAFAACSSGDDGDADSSATTASATEVAVAPVASVADVYAVPDPLPPGEPGDLIQIEPIAPPEDAPDASAWRVLYHSRSLEGDDIAVSGVIVRPPGDAPAGGFPVLAWAHGTTGTADSCAPSAFAPTDHALLPGLLEAGYVVASTDYEGLGTPGLHPYLVGESEGRGVLDAARAATRFDGVDAGTDVMVWGHSQGGHAALFAGEIAPVYAPDLDVAGVVAIAPVGDVTLIAPAVLSTPALFGFGFMAFGTWPTAYPGLDIGVLLGPAAIERLPLLDEVCAGPIFDAMEGVAIEQLVASAEPLQASPFAELLAANSVGVRPYGDVPVLVVHGTDDELIPVPLSENLVASLCGGGADAELRTYPATHGSIPTLAEADALAWSTDRLAGAAPTTGC